MRRIFADTFYWIAVLNPRDQAHGRALALGETLHLTQIVTTDEVLTEFLNYCSARGDFQRRVASRAVERMQVDRTVRILPQTRDGFLAGLGLYRARPDKGYSLTDCISMEAMRREGLTDVLTDDAHFAQEGFVCLLRD
jgi:predicted nucleic acid-binding protein